jgi:hypothetical protein
MQSLKQLAEESTEICCRPSDDEVVDIRSLTTVDSGLISPRSLHPTHEPLGDSYFAPLGNGELVVRFFGLKDVDTLVTGANVLPGMVLDGSIDRWYQLRTMTRSNRA